MHIVHPCHGCSMYHEIDFKKTVSNPGHHEGFSKFLEAKVETNLNSHVSLKKSVFLIYILLNIGCGQVGFIPGSRETVVYETLLTTTSLYFIMLLSCLSNRPVGFIACLCAVFSAQVHGNRTGMTRPGHRSLQNANAEQNKRRYSARFLYNSTPSFSAPEASTAGTMAGPPPDLISTWHDLSIKRAFYHWPHAGLSFC